MKRNGFTLAEILISIAIIGIVAAISLPTLGVSARKQANKSAYKVAKSDIETAFGAMMVANAEDEIRNIEGWNTISKLEKFIKIDSDGVTKNGTQIKFDGDKLTMDVNGPKGKPNKLKVDQFECTVDDYGLLECDVDEE